MLNKTTCLLKIWEKFARSGVVTGAGIAQYNDGLDDPVSIPGRRKRFISTPQQHTDSPTHPSSGTMGTGGSLRGDKAAGHEAGHSPPSSVKVKNGGAIPLFPHTSWRGV
jgi:hypothetical protein